MEEGWGNGGRQKDGVHMQKQHTEKGKKGRKGGTYGEQHSSSSSTARGDDRARADRTRDTTSILFLSSSRRGRRVVK